jgi:hypothetical protein
MSRCFALVPLCSLLAVLPGACADSPKPVAPPAPAKPAPPSARTNAPAGVGALFDGKTLAGWALTDFAGRGVVTVEQGQIKFGDGHMTGITWTNDLPRMNYEVSLDAQRVDGSDFFCGLTFPVGKEPCSFIVGGWGGGVVGLSSINGEDASQNETTSYMNFVKGRWYHVRVRVEPGKIQAWIDGDRVVNLDTEDKKLGVRMEVEPCVPLGIAAWNTAAALKNIQIKKL